MELSVNDRKPLIALVTGLPMGVFTASDSLGWCYQFWQAERKDEVNASGKKIGADETVILFSTGGGYKYMEAWQSAVG